MDTKQTYTTPECVLRTTWQAMALCASNTLDPIGDNNDVIEWDD